MNLGIKPTKISNGYCLFHSPYRKEKTPSFKVCNIKNLWVDYGDNNAGGSLIDLVLKMNPGFGVYDAIENIARVVGNRGTSHSNSITKHTKHDIESATESRVKILGIKDLGHNLSLTSYLNSRGIGLDTAKPFCKEVYYSIDDKRYFGIGNQNKDGWNIRNKYWKGCSAQGYSYFNNRSDQLCVFEGIFDLLSYREIQNSNRIKEDYLVLNSLVNINKAIPILKKYEHVDLFLDQDKAGKSASKNLTDTFPQYLDQGHSIFPYKDLNEYLVEGLGKRLRR
jgi:5S rRNA maturation endonuclease (ribonuclease M5)